MTSDTSGTTKMILQYKWILDNVENQEPKTFASKMISFRGKKVFRVGLRNHVKSPLLFLVAIDLNKIGMKVEDVLCGNNSNSGVDPATMWEMVNMKTADYDATPSPNLQLFKTNFIEQFVGKRTFVFRICIKGSDYFYSYRLSDRLAKEQLWAAAKNKNSVDVEFVVKNKKFCAHKSILAARSKVFAGEFTKEQPAGDASGHQVEPNSKRRKTNNAPLLQIQIDDAEPATVEQFLYFIYTGESMGTFANEDLLKIAVKYRLKTLVDLCKEALKKIDSSQMVKLTNAIHNNTGIPHPTIIKPDVETEIIFDRASPTFRCSSSFQVTEQGKSKSMMQYQNEEIFIAYFTGEAVTNPINKEVTVSKPVIHLSCAKHRKFGLDIKDVYCKLHIKSFYTLDCFKMEPKHSQGNAELLQHFTAQLNHYDFQSKYNKKIYFDVKMVTAIDNYCYEMTDDAWKREFWFAATKLRFTDVEISVGAVKVMEAHRVILCARSSVMNAAFKKMKKTGKLTFTFGAEFDVDIVKHFLQFLYTGSLESPSKKPTDYKELLKLATAYKVETLKNICQVADRVPDVEEFTNSLLQL